MQTKKELIPEIGCTKIYEIDINQRSLMGGIPNENKVHLKVRKKLCKKNKKGYVYHIEVIERKQYNTKDLRGLEDDLAPLFQNIELQTNFEGQIIEIINLYQIKTPWFWECSRSKFIKKHKERENIHTITEDIDTILNSHILFLESFKQSEIATLLFPPIYAKPMQVGSSLIEEKEFTDFFGDIALSLQITTTLKEYQKPDTSGYTFLIGRLDNASTNKGKAKLLRTGILHPKKFDKQAVKKYFRELADNYRLLAHVNTKYLETYDIDEQHHIDHAGQLLSVEIKNLFLFNQVVRVRSIPALTTAQNKEI